MKWLMLLMIFLPLFGEYRFVPQIGHTDEVFSVTITPDGKYIVSGSWDNTIKVWRTKDGKLIRTLKGHRNVVT